MKDALTLSRGLPLEELFVPLSSWYRENARPLPWRENATPYHVWLSEVMLQQTRIEAVRPYYARFLAAAPDIPALAALSDDRLMKLWEGLGYYSRARNLGRTAIVLCEQYGAQMPRDYAALRALPGIGEYTAGAIASIAFDLPTPAVDGNVLRVVCRLTADRSDVLAPATKKRITARLFALYEKCCRQAGDAATLTQALMELGEVLCLPNRAPLCDACPLAPLCRAREEKCQTEIPFRSPKKARKESHKLVLLLRDDKGRYAIRRRPEDGLLGGLWELPHIDLPTPSTEDGDALDRLAREFCRENGLLAAESTTLPPSKHIFTHLTWQMQGCYINVTQTEHTSRELLFVSPEELRTQYALPTAFAAYRRIIVAKT
ncbi:MAG: A/G-specific adenine glycosylase [Clostridia bacterium]|nr:A/G-specific adenine glycosylase [Clostridia bacterium]